MLHKNWLRKLWLVILAATLLLGPGDSSWSADDFYVIGGGSPWKRNGNNIYYDKGNVGIGITDPSYLFHISTTSNPVPMRVQTDASGTNTNAIQAVANYGVGVSGYTVTGKGVLGNAQGGAIGVQGECTGSGAGVYGYNSANGPGVKGYSAASNGVYGETSSTSLLDAGVYGKNNGPGYGVYGLSNALGGTGVLGASSIPGGYGVFCSGNFGASGAKNAIVPTSQGNRKLYSQESPEVWFEDVGEGQLVDGKTRIVLDPLFLETVTINDQHPLKVFIQLNDDCNGVYVQRQASGFEVKELRRGTSSAQFTYRVMAKRKGFETARLEAAGDAPKMAALKETKE